MAKAMNLGLDVSGETGESRVARVYLDLACSYLKGQGAATLTADCASFAELEHEIQRLKDECDALLEQARGEFGVAAEAGGDVAGSGASDTSKDTSPVDKIHLRIGGDLRVEDEMTRNVETVYRNDKLSVADELMKGGRFRHVVVIDEDTDGIAGVVSHRDIFHGALAWSTGQGEAAHQKALGAMPVKNVMSSDVTIVAPDTSLAEAARILLEQKIGCLVVVRSDKLVGILTEGDFLSMLTRAEYGAEPTAPDPA